MWKLLLIARAQSAGITDKWQARCGENPQRRQRHQLFVPTAIQEGVPMLSLDCVSL